MSVPANETDYQRLLVLADKLRSEGTKVTLSIYVSDYSNTSEDSYISLEIKGYLSAEVKIAELLEKKS